MERRCSMYGLGDGKPCEKEAVGLAAPREGMKGLPRAVCESHKRYVEALGRKVESLRVMPKA